MKKNGSKGQKGRIKREVDRLKALYEQVDEKKQKVVEGLIVRAAFMRVSLEDFENDIAKNGYVEPFSQGQNQEPYDRKRPVADLYNTMNAGYQKIVKQLTDLLPREVSKPEDDGFNDFATGREEL